MQKKLFYLLAPFLLGMFFIPCYAALQVDTGAFLRLRNEYWKNMFDMDNSVKDNRNFFRIKASGWVKVSLEENDYAQQINLFLKMTDEFKAYTYFANRSNPNGDKKKAFDINEVVWDNFYLEFKFLFDLPLDLRVGRQDFLGTYGEGFLIMDGTPLDGSRTFYFNALRVRWNINSQNTLDAIYIHNPRDEEMFPPINENKPLTRLNFSDEQAGVLYWLSDSIENCHMENYYIYKWEDNDGGIGLQQQTSKINTLGTFIKYVFPEFVLRSQLAYQFGKYGDNDRQGIGGYIFFDKALSQARFSPKFSLGYVYLSGDDPDTSRMEAWDPLFSRWPWMSELYVVSYNDESGLGYWTNLQLWRAEAKFKINDKINLSLWYNFLKANQKVSGTIFGQEKNRGHLPQVRLDYSVNKNVHWYILAEYFIPQDFYAPASRNEALFLRTELSFRF